MPGDEHRQSRVSVTPGGAWLTHWRPGYAMPTRFAATIDGDWLPYVVELELATDRDAVHCRAVRLLAREDGGPITARALRDVPLGECIRLATSAALRPFTEEATEIVIPLGGPQDMTEAMELSSRGPQRRVSDEWLREAADIYRSADDKPTKAVQLRHSQAPMSYSTAARWVMEARRREFLPPTKRGRGGTLAAAED